MNEAKKKESGGPTTFGSDCSMLYSTQKMQL